MESWEFAPRGSRRGNLSGDGAHVLMLVIRILCNTSKNTICDRRISFHTFSEMPQWSTRSRTCLRGMQLSLKAVAGRQWTDKHSCSACCPWFYLPVLRCDIISDFLMLSHPTLTLRIPHPFYFLHLKSNILILSLRDLGVIYAARCLVCRVNFLYGF